ncbi:Clavaminate synthase-like protein [Meredithblackwellia eburnea MCA 4105]
MVVSPSFSQFTLPEGRTLSAAPFAGTDREGLQFPLALQVDKSLKTVDEVVSAIETLEASGELKRLLVQHGGALIIRGTHAAEPAEFSKLVHAFKLGNPHHELGNPVIRNIFAKNVATANEGPQDLPVYPHSEFGWSRNFPDYISFFCRHPADTGGETPINSGLEVLARVQAEIPQLIEELKNRGAQYQYRYQRHVNPNSNSGNSLARAYPDAGLLETDDEDTLRAKIEPQVKRHADIWSWADDGTLTVTHKLKSIREHPETKEEVWFGNLVSQTLLARRYGALDYPHKGTDGAYHQVPAYGDGTPIPIEWLLKVADIIDEVRVLINWQLGDLLLLDNYLVQHARQPSTGDRRILASLWDSPGHEVF